MGKIQYNAPEQRRSAAEVDHRADIYPLGVIFFEMLTGHRPKPGEKLCALRPDLPKECDEFLAKAMAENPEDRFATAGEFHNALLELYRKVQEQKTHIVTAPPSGFRWFLNAVRPGALVARWWRSRPGPLETAAPHSSHPD